MKKPFHTNILIVFAVFLLNLSPGRAQNTPVQLPDSSYIKENYIKYEYQIPMRDGIKLFTSVLVPKDKTQKHPIILSRTPYSVKPYGEDKYPNFFNNLSSAYLHKGYVLVNQDVRGRFMSEGQFVDVRPYIPVKKSKTEIDETTDTFDTVDWLIKNIPDNNARVGIKGISYPGFYTSMGTIDAHPAVKATSPQAPVSQWMGGDDWFHNGAFLLSHAFDFYVNIGWPRVKPNTRDFRVFHHGTPDGYRFFIDLGPLPDANTKFMKDSVAFWKELIKHGSSYDTFWEARNVLPHMKNVKPATMVVGGWFDTENLYGALHLYDAIEKQNHGKMNMLVMGPWSHGVWANGSGDSLGYIHWGSQTNYFYRDSLEVPFFEYYLRDVGKPKLPEAAVFLTGANEWKRFDSWPPKNAEPKYIYLQEGGKLSFEPPAKTTSEYDEYLNDPFKPIPYTAQVTEWYNPGFMLEDQRFAEKRPDVLTYKTDLLMDNITIAGPIQVTLYGSTSGTDCDWILKVIDVFPDTLSTPSYYPPFVKMGGYEMLIRGDVLRGKFRNSLSRPEPFDPNKVTKIEFVLQDAFHTFKKGHRIMVQIQSTWFPMIDRNPGKFEDIFQAKESDFQKTTQRVYRTAKFQTNLKMNVVK